MSEDVAPTLNTGQHLSFNSSLIAHFLGIVHHREAQEFSKELPEGAIDLMYLDPPFGKGREFKGREGLAFDDSWGSFGGYLVWLRELLTEVPRLLSPRGTLFLHLDPLAVHYAKVMLDEIFGRSRFLNEIIWHHTGGGRSKRYFSRKHQTILWYSKTDDYTFNLEQIRQPYAEGSRYGKSGITAASGKHYPPNPAGTLADDVWTIPMVNPMAVERVGYPTQKPIALLERIIAVASHPGDVVADLFCGSGTTLVAAHQLGRNWIGSDQSEDAVRIAKERLHI